MPRKSSLKINLIPLAATFFPYACAFSSLLFLPPEPNLYLSGTAEALNITIIYDVLFDALFMAKMKLFGILESTNSLTCSCLTLDLSV
jgi:hypothetical protein